jgi:sugar phosphate isomerase/epimerase
VQVALNGISTMPYPFLTDIRVAREAGYDGLVVVGDKLRRYLAEGFDLADATLSLSGVPVLGFGSVRDIERSSDADRAALDAECEDACRLAQAIGCSQVQLLTGPLDPDGPYRAPLTMAPADLHDAAVTNILRIAEIGHRFGVGFYLEPLAWTPLHDLTRVLRILDDAERDNVGLALDFWHLWNSGIEPDEIARIDGGLIRMVDVCDALGPRGTRSGHDQRGRRVWTGGGEIPLKAWVDAIRATGFDGTWSCELLSPQHWELDPFDAARAQREFLSYLFV